VGVTGEMIDAARGAVQDACAVCRRVQQDIEQLRSMTKDDRSPVTVADFASQAVVAHRLREAMGDIRLVAEEASAQLRRDDHRAVLDKVVEAARSVWPEATRESVLEAIDLGDDDASSLPFWTLDPIDGTKGFLRGGQYAVSLAWVDHSGPALGLLGCPNMAPGFEAAFDEPDPTGRIFLAVRGDGVQVGPADGGEPMRRVTRIEPEEGQEIRVCESVEAEHSKHDTTVRVLESLGVKWHALRLDSQAKYAVVARGQADAYMRMPTRKGYVERIWDHAAGALVAAETGCVVTDVDSKPLDFSRGVGLEGNRGIVCAAKGLHARIIRAIADLDASGEGSPV
jgi:3'(2'), 5'-bisphosphate nucleotidase